MAISPYVARLRSKLGSDLLLLPAAAVLLTDDQGRVLLVRQSDYGEWGTIGGMIEVDESPAEAAVREAAEEIGAVVEITDLLGAVGGPEFRITYPNGDQCAVVGIIHRGRIVSDDISPDLEEVTEARWFPVDELALDPDMGEFALATFRAIGWID